MSLREQIEKLRQDVGHTIPAAMASMGYNEAIDDILALLAASPVEAEGWQPIASAPKDGTAILLWNQETKSVNVGYWNDHYTEPWHAIVLGSDAMWNDEDGPNPIFSATHWRPLPLPPVRPSKE